MASMGFWLLDSWHYSLTIPRRNNKLIINFQVVWYLWISVDGSKPYFLIWSNRTMHLLKLLIEPSQCVLIIGAGGTSKFDESKWIHRIVDRDVFCTLYLLNTPKFSKPNVFNGFLSFVFGLKTLFGINRLINKSSRLKILHPFSEWWECEEFGI